MRELYFRREVFWLLASGGAMTIVLIIGAAAGVILGLGRFKVLALLPVILIVAAGAITSSVATGFEPRTIALGVLVAVASPQIGYERAPSA